MERNANYALVGLASAILTVGLVVFLVLLAGRKFSHDYDVYDIVFQGPVRGIAAGGEVHFNGIKVGDVSKIFLDPRNPQFVVARARITPDVPIRIDSYATLEPQGITGVNYIQITAGTPSKPLLRDTVREGQIPRIPSQKDALSDLLAGGGFIVQRTVEALDRVNRVFSDENIKTLGATMSDVQAVTAELRERKAVIADLQKTLQDSDETVRQFTALGKSGQNLVDGDGRKTLAKLSDAAGEIEASAKALRETMAKLQGPAENFATTGLPQVTGAIASLQRATDHLDHVLSEVEANPQGVLSKAPAKEVEIRP
jgi:phospholipid/cholesterol/gamma-HCH transport system substrate-binding protein